MGVNVGELTRLGSLCGASARNESRRPAQLCFKKKKQLKLCESTTTTRNDTLIAPTLQSDYNFSPEMASSAVSKKDIKFGPAPPANQQVRHSL